MGSLESGLEALAIETEVAHAPAVPARAPAPFGGGDVQSTGNTFLSHFFVGAGAAAAFECLKLYDLKHKVSHKKYKKLIHSTLFWLVVAGMLAASGFFAWVFYAERADASAAQLAIAGIAARAFIREGLAAATSKQPVKLGSEDNQRLSARDIFQ